MFFPRVFNNLLFRKKKKKRDNVNVLSVCFIIITCPAYVQSCGVVKVNKWVVNLGLYRACTDLSYVLKNQGSPSPPPPPSCVQFNIHRISNLMFVPWIIRRSRNNQHYALICTTALFYTLAPTCFGSSLPSLGSFLDPSVLHENRDRFGGISYKHIRWLSGLCAGVLWVRQTDPEAPWWWHRISSFVIRKGGWTRSVPNFFV
jgi:hypothetical protein